MHLVNMLYGDMITEDLEIYGDGISPNIKIIKIEIPHYTECYKLK